MSRHKRTGVFVLFFNEMSIGESMPHTVHAPFFHSRQFGLAFALSPACSCWTGEYRSGPCAKWVLSRGRFARLCLSCVNPPVVNQSTKNAKQKKRRLFTKAPYLKHKSKELGTLARTNSLKFIVRN